MKSPRLQARIAGLLYLLVFVMGPAVLAINGQIIAGRDAAATAANIEAQEQLFRIGFVGNLIATAAYLGVVAMLFRLFQPAGRTLSTVAAAFGLAGCIISGAAMIAYLAPVYVLGDAPYLAAFDRAQLEAQATVFWRLGAMGNSIGLTFFGLYCLTLSALVFKARFMPRVIGAFLVLAGAAWLIGNVGSFLFPALGRYSTYMIGAGGIGELVFTLWILIMGVNETRWKEHAAAA